VNIIKRIIDSYDTTNIYLVKDLIKNPKGVVAIVHGLAEYCDRYEHLAKSLTEEGYAVYRFDLRGHGKSGSVKGWVEDYNFYIKDLDVVVDIAKKDYSQKPIFILGHSMGGFITAVYGIRASEKIKGIILSAAALESPKEAKGLSRLMISIGSKICPKLKIKNNLGKLISKDKKLVEKYNNDPLVLKKITIKLYYEFLIRGIDWLTNNRDKFTVPCLMLHGEEDKIINHQVSLNFEKEIRSKDKKAILYSGLYHEIFNEEEKDIVIKDVKKWLNSKT